MTIIVGVILAQFIKRKPGDVGQFPDGEAKIPEERQNASGGYSLKEAVHIPQFWITILIFFCCGFFGYSILVHIIPFSIVLGIHPAASAGLLAVIGGVSILGGFCSGALTDRIGVKKSLAFFLMMALCSLIWLFLSREIGQLYLFAVVFGLGYGSIGVSETIISVWLFGLKANALILSIIDLGLTLGAASGPLLAGYVFDLTESYRSAFILTAVISLSGLLLTLFLKPLKTAAVSQRNGE